jgi:hypothetical protein
LWVRRGLSVASAVPWFSKEPIPPSRNRLNETRVFRIVPEREADFAYGGVDPVLGIDKNIFAPETLDDLLPCDEMPILGREQDEQLHGIFFELYGATGAQKFVAVAVEGELVEPDEPCWHEEVALRRSRKYSI